MITAGLNDLPSKLLRIQMAVVFCWESLSMAMLSVMDMLGARQFFRSHSPLRSRDCLAHTCVCKSHLTTKHMVCF